MLINIVIAVSLCANVSMSDVNKKRAELEAANPGAKVTVRLDKKCTKEAK
jgi:hypothetical protein